MGRFRKAKKAYKKGVGNVPLWWNGNAKQRNLQARWYWWTLVKEWNAKAAVATAKLALISGQAAVQMAVITSQAGGLKEEKILRLAELQLDVAQSALKVYEELGPKPRLADHIKPAFTTASKKDRFYSVDFGLKMKMPPPDFTQFAKFTQA